MATRHAFLLASLLLAACGDNGETTQEVSVGVTGAEPIIGTLSYRERISLGPGAEAEVRLLDVSDDGVPPTTLGISRFRDPGLPPIDFRLEFNPANIEERKKYVVRAEIRDGERLLFTTKEAYPVLTRGAGYSVDLMLVAVDHEPPPPPPLFGTYWKLIALGQLPVPTRPPPQDAHLLLQDDGASKTATGNSGCNRFTGAYTVESDSLSFGPLASTRMACVDTMELEARFLDAMSRVDRYEIVDRELRLFGGDEPLMTFVAAKAGV